MAGILLALLLFCAGNVYLDWKLLDGFGEEVLAVVTFVGGVLTARYGPGLVRELEEYRTAQNEKFHRNDT